MIGGGGLNIGRRVNMEYFLAVVAFARGEDEFGVDVSPEVFMRVEGFAVVVFQHPEALEVGLEDSWWRVFVVEHRCNEFKHYLAICPC